MTVRTRSFKHFLKRLVLQLNGVPDYRAAARAPQEEDDLTNPPKFSRLMGDQRHQRQTFLQRADNYVAGLTEEAFEYLYRKPFVLEPPSGSVFTQMYQLLNIVQTMDLPEGSRIVEVGCGPGWITEYLVLLGYRVEALDPCAAMIQIARDRVTAAWQHHRRPGSPQVTFHRTALEDFTFSEESCDGVLFHEALHHLVDEEEGLKRCFRLLRPGGVVGITGESAWVPGNRPMEALYQEETVRAGTMESPFTTPYLRYLLHKVGFEAITHYHGVNGLIPIEMEHRRVAEVARFHALDFNTFTARKPEPVPTTANPQRKSRAGITVLDTHFDAARRQVKLRLQLHNQGETVWLTKRQYGGYVTIAFRQGRLGAADFLEAIPRCQLPRPVSPGETLVMEADYLLPETCSDAPWWVDLVNEDHFWFSTRGTIAARVTLPPLAA